MHTMIKLMRFRLRNHFYTTSSMTNEESSFKIISRTYFRNDLREDFYEQKDVGNTGLDERNLLVKKITDKIAKVSFVDTIKPNEDKVYAIINCLGFCLNC